MTAVLGLLAEAWAASTVCFGMLLAVLAAGSCLHRSAAHALARSRHR